MVEEANLRAKSDDDLAAMLKECVRRQESLAHSASERLKQSESAGWDDSLHQEALGLLADAGRLSEEGDLIAKEFERRYGHAALSAWPNIPPPLTSQRGLGRVQRL